MIQENIPADAPAEVRTPTSGEGGASLGRLTSVDVLRGLVMVSRKDKERPSLMPGLSST